MKKPFIIIILILAALAGAGWLVLSADSPENDKAAGKPKQKKPPLVGVAPAFFADVSRTLELTGSVEPYKKAELASPAEGPLQELEVREGDRVKAGEEIVYVGRKKGAEALIVSLKQKLEKERANLERKRRLEERGAVAEEELDAARAGFEEARARLIQAEETLSDYAIAAPWDGIISGVNAKEGQFVAPRTSLIEMYDPDSLVIRAAVPERHAAKMAAGTRADIRLDAYPGKRVQGRIERVYPYLDEKTRTRTLEIVPEESIDLLPGMFARLFLVLQTADNAVVVPKEAVVSTAQGPAVFVVEEGRALRRPVKTGIEQRGRIQIISGVLAGEKVVVEGNQKLKSGAEVRLVQNQAADGPGQEGAQK
ncbi:MAG: efflux RND transporter periplasmic adaptor subunit [Desulfobacterales bacterium]